MIPHGFALDAGRAEAVVCPASAAAGSYGAPQHRRVDRGLYLVLADDAVGVRDSNSADARVDGAGGKLEIPVTPNVPLPLLVRSNALVVAAKDAKCTAWIVPLVPLTDEARTLLERACAPR